MSLALYSPYWILNQTKLDIEYKVELLKLRLIYLEVFSKRKTFVLNKSSLVTTPT